MTKKCYFSIYNIIGDSYKNILWYFNYARDFLKGDSLKGLQHSQMMEWPPSVYLN